MIKSTITFVICFMGYMAGPNQKFEGDEPLLFLCDIPILFPIVTLESRMEMLEQAISMDLLMQYGLEATSAVIILGPERKYLGHLASNLRAIFERASIEKPST